MAKAKTVEQPLGKDFPAPVPDPPVLHYNWQQREIDACVRRLQGLLFNDEARTEPQTRAEILTDMATSFQASMTLANWEFLADVAELCREEAERQGGAVSTSVGTANAD